MGYASCLAHSLPQARVAQAYRENHQRPLPPLPQPRRSGLHFIGMNSPTKPHAVPASHYCDSSSVKKSHSLGARESLSLVPERPVTRYSPPFGHTPNCGSGVYCTQLRSRPDHSDVIGQGYKSPTNQITPFAKQIDSFCDRQDRASKPGFPARIAPNSSFTHHDEAI